MRAWTLALSAAALLGACAVPAPKGAAVSVAQPYHWRHAVIGGGGFVSGLLFNPQVPGLAFARTDVGGAYRWDAGAKRWIPLDDSMDRTPEGMDRTGVLAIALDPTDKDRVYLATGIYTQSWWPVKGGTLYSSTDQGRSFTRQPLPVQLGGNNDGRGCGERLQVDPKLPGRLLLGTTKDGLWQSFDRGAHWQRMDSFKPAAATFTFIDPAGPGLLVGVADPAIGLLQSLDNGKTWARPAGFPAGLMALRWARSGRRLYLTASDSIGPNGAHKGAVLALDLGSGALTALPVPGGMGGFSGIDVDAHDPQTLIVSTLNRWDPQDEIYRSLDGGQTWKEVLLSGSLDTTGFPWVAGHKPHWIADVKLDPFDRDRALFVTGYGLWASRDLDKAQGPVTWAFEDQGLEETVPLKIVSPPWGAPLYSAIGDQAGFSHWDLDQAPSRGPGEPPWGSARSIACSWSKPGLLLRAGDFEQGQKAVYSTDAGKSWAYFPSQTAGPDCGEVAVATDASFILWCPGGKPCVRSSDLGKSWTPVAGLPQDVQPQCDTVDPSLAYALDVPAGALYVSQDGGQSFQASAALFPGNPERSHGDLRPVPGRRGEVWVALDAGLWTSKDAGRSFKKAENVSSAPHAGFGVPAPGARSPSAYLAGTVDGVYGFFRSDDAGEHWIRINDDAHQFGYIHAIIGDGQVYGRAYVAAEGRGILVGQAAP